MINRMNLGIKSPRDNKKEEFYTPIADIHFEHLLRGEVKEQVEKISIGI